MDLTEAGIVSGAGQGIMQAAQTAQAGMIQQGLMQQREELENKRLEMTQRFAIQQADLAETRAQAREDRGATREAGLLDRKVAAEQALQQGRIGSDLTQKGMEISSKKESDKESNRLKDKELDMKKSYYDKVLARLTSGAGGKSSKAGEAREYIQSVTKPMLDNLAKQRETASPEEQVLIDAKTEAILEHAAIIASVPGMAGRKNGAPIDNPFPPAKARGASAAAVPTTDAAPTPEAPASSPISGLLSTPEDVTVQPKRPITSRGGMPNAKQQKAQAQYDLLEVRKELDQAKVHGSKQMIKRLEERLRQLEAQSQ